MMHTYACILPSQLTCETASEVSALTARSVHSLTWAVARDCFDFDGTFPHEIPGTQVKFCAPNDLLRCPLFLGVNEDRFSRFERVREHQRTRAPPTFNPH